MVATVGECLNEVRRAELMIRTHSTAARIALENEDLRGAIASFDRSRKAAKDARDWADRARIANQGGLRVVV